MAERLTPERTVRLLRAKAAELENHVRGSEMIDTQMPTFATWLAADIALIAGLLADHIERFDEMEKAGEAFSADLAKNLNAAIPWPGVRPRNPLDLPVPEGDPPTGESPVTEWTAGDDVEDGTGATGGVPR
jgi:hypothetical protein